MQSPLTIRALLHWRDQIADGVVPLRDIIDLEATYAKINGNPLIDQTTIGPLGDDIPDDDLEDDEPEEERGRTRMKMKRTKAVTAIPIPQPATRTMITMKMMT